MFALRRLALVASASLIAISCTASSDRTPGGSGGKNGAGSGGVSGGSGGSATGSGGSAAGSGGSTAMGTGGASSGSGGTITPADGGGSGGATMSDAGPMEDAGRAPANPSTGCGMPADQALATYVTKNIMTGGMARSYRLYLPDGYDPMKAYPTIILAHGCGGNGGLPFPIETASKNEAIVAALKSVGTCFDQGPNGIDVPYFDAVLAEISAKHCVDKARVFMGGFSSGSWLTYTIGCVRAGVVRGTGNASGNQVGGLPTCKGPIAALIAHDVNDDQNSFAGGMMARDRILKTNGCSTQTLPYDWDGDPTTPSPCVIYQGCMPGYPVVWCPTMAPPGQPTHNNQVPITTVGLWRFWKQF